jgi:hypothetical protein
MTQYDRELNRTHLWLLRRALGWKCFLRISYWKTFRAAYF